MDRDFGGQWSKLWRLGLEKGKVNPHPIWEFAAKKVVNGRVVLIGDCAHMSSPKTGAGAYTTCVDALMLARFFQQHFEKSGLDKTLEGYNADGVKRAKQLYDASVSLRAAFKKETGHILESLK